MHQLTVSGVGVWVEMVLMNWSGGGERRGHVVRLIHGEHVDIGAVLAWDLDLTLAEREVLHMKRGVVIGVDTYSSVHHM